MYGCENWTINKAECWRTDAFELWCWRRLLRVPWTARRSNQSILKEISPEYSLERLMLKQKLQYLATWFEELTHWKDPDAGKGWRQEEKCLTEMVGWHYWLNGHEFEQALGVGDRQGNLAYCSPWGWKGSNTTEWLNWTNKLGIKDRGYGKSKKHTHFPPLFSSWCLAQWLTFNKYLLNEWVIQCFGPEMPGKKGQWIGIYFEPYLCQVVLRLLWKSNVGLTPPSQLTC